MDIKSKVIDISSFLLFEATGDSETGCFDPAMSGINHDDDDDDDAESCSCDTTSDFLPGVRELNSSEDKANVGDDDDDDHGDEVDDGEVVELKKEARLHEKCRDHQRFKGVLKEKKSSSVFVDPTKTMKEKNRLFWEACLAS